MAAAATAETIYQGLLQYYGPQHWWPADSEFEVMIGAVLTQNTRWEQVKRAISNIKACAPLHASDLLAMDTHSLETCIRPAGFFSQKAATLQRISQWVAELPANWQHQSRAEKRAALLAIKGIGPETADSILLYAMCETIFIIDAYTLRIFKRLGLLPENCTYAQAQQWFEQRLKSELSLFQEYHALIVQHAKTHCTKRSRCQHCPLQAHCPAYYVD